MANATMKLNDIIKMIPVLNKIKVVELDDVRLAYNLKKFIKSVNEEIELFETTRKEIFEKYAEKNEDGTKKINENNEPFILQQDKIDAYIKEINDLLSIDVDIREFTLTIDKIVSLGLKLSSNDLELLEPIMPVDEDTNN